MFSDIVSKIRDNRSVSIIAAGILIFFIIAALLPGCSTPSVTPNTGAKPADAPAPAPIPAPAPVPKFYPKPSGPIKEKWINAAAHSDTLSVSAEEIRTNWNTAFKMTDKGKTLNFMAYVYNGEIQVRANVCPPCRSIGYTLDKEELICDTCGTTFKAADGSGIQGACVKYPKAAIKYRIESDNLVMNINELVDAYERTLNGKG